MMARIWLAGSSDKQVRHEFKAFSLDQIVEGKRCSSKGTAGGGIAHPTYLR
ncbi:MAG: hypothetical protein ACE10C_01150 [Candidatus Binatia bacterium]